MMSGGALSKVLAWETRHSYDAITPAFRELKMNPFADMENDTVIIARQGEEVARYQCVFVEPKLTIMGDEVDVLEGDTLFQLLPNGKRVEFQVEDVSYRSGLDDMCGCFTLALEKVRAKPKRAVGSTTNHITINSSNGIQIGDYNVQNLEIIMKDVLNAIENADAPQADKKEARNRLQRFLEHPLVIAAVGASIPATLGLFD